jgi:hypothetical protein
MRQGFVDEEQLAIPKIKNFNKAANTAIIDPSVGLLVSRLAALAYNLILGIADLYEATATSHPVCEHGWAANTPKANIPPIASTFI